MRSKKEKYQGQAVSRVQDEGGLEGDYVMMFEKAKYYAVLKLKEVWTSENLVVQYEVRFNKGLDCGGAYVKLWLRTLQVLRMSTRVVVHYHVWTGQVCK